MTSFRPKICALVHLRHGPTGVDDELRIVTPRDNIA